MFGHFSKRFVVLVEGLHFTDPGHADGLFDLVAETNLLGLLHVARDEIDFLAHLAIASVPFECDQTEAEPVQHQANDLQPLLVHVSLSSSVGV